MNGPDHYREAEKLLGIAKGMSSGAGRDNVLAAHVHMTAALTAAVYASTAHRMQPADRHQWLTAIDPEYAAEQAAGQAARAAQ